AGEAHLASVLEHEGARVDGLAGEAGRKCRRPARRGSRCGGRRHRGSRHRAVFSRGRLRPHHECGEENQAGPGPRALCTRPRGHGPTEATESGDTGAKSERPANLAWTVVFVVLSSSRPRAQTTIRIKESAQIPACRGPEGDWHAPPCI